MITNNYAEWKAQMKVAVAAAEFVRLVSAAKRSATVTPEDEILKTAYAAATKLANDLERECFVD